MRVTLIPSIRSLDPGLWKRFESPDYPFLDYEFLLALEETESIGLASGWQMAFLALESAEGLCAIHPSYVKSNSYGEYIFDWDWARFYSENQTPYYPKLLSALPFTPATGPRLLLSDATDALARRHTLVASALNLAQSSGMSSYHALFLEPDEASIFEARGCTLRHSLQYHWHNKQYRDFSDYLDSFLGKRRRDILRERRHVREQGLVIERLTGKDLKPELGQVMEDLYRTTIDKKEAIAYLQPGFFQKIFSSMSDRILLVTAKDEGRIVAASLNLFKGEKLYGRYWGALQHYPDLHFELCYYQTLEFAMERGLKVFEAGAQGEHKIQRGFLPKIILSAHKILDPRFEDPIARYIEAEKQHFRQAIASLQSQSPFRTSEPGMDLT